MSNKEVRIAIIQANIRQYQLDDKLGIFEQNFSRKMSYEMYMLYSEIYSIA